MRHALDSLRLGRQLRQSASWQAAGQPHPELQDLGRQGPAPGANE